MWRKHCLVVFFFPVMKLLHIIVFSSWILNPSLSLTAALWNAYALKYSLCSLKPFQWPCSLTQRVLPIFFYSVPHLLQFTACPRMTPSNRTDNFPRLRPNFHLCVPKASSKPKGIFHTSFVLYQSHILTSQDLSFRLWNGAQNHTLWSMTNSLTPLPT